MNSAEELLKNYTHLKKEAERLMRELAMAKHAYERCAEELPSSCRYSVIKTRERRIAKPVEINVMIMLDEYKAQVESIERRLKRTREDIEGTERILEDAGLDVRQREYINLRYFTDLSAEATSQRMYCSGATCRRIKKNALEKIMSVIN